MNLVQKGAGTRENVSDRLSVEPTEPMPRVCVEVGPREPGQPRRELGDPHVGLEPWPLAGRCEGLAGAGGSCALFFREQTGWSF